MHRKYGVCTWTFGDRPIDDIAARVAALGFDGVELHGDLEAFEPTRIRALFDRHGLEIFSLTPANVDLAHPDDAVRGQAVDYYRRLIDFAAALGGPRVSCHGMVGRVRALANQEFEWQLLIESLRDILPRAQAAGLTMVFEVLNRYESHLVNNLAQAMQLIDALDGLPLQILLDAYHMNIEEADPVAAIKRAGSRLGLFHVADSNRLGLGAGHTGFAPILRALDDADYRGAIIVEATAAGPDPFSAEKDGDYLAALNIEWQRSLQYLRQHETVLAV